MLPLHPRAAEHMGAGGGAPAHAAPDAPLELLYFNGLTGRGHEGKGLRAVRVEPGAARGQPMATQGLAACLQTRWKDGLVSYDGPPPSIN
jgi:hypothetical protein